MACNLSNAVKNMKDNKIDPVKAIVGLTKIMNTKSGRVLHAALCDENTLTKLICFKEDLFDAFQVGHIVRLSNYAFKSGEFVIFATSGTKAAKLMKAGVPANMQERCSFLLNPPEGILCMAQLKAGDFGTIRGTVKKVDDVRNVGHESIPKRTIVLEDGTNTALVALWRDLAGTTIEPGQTVTITSVTVKLFDGVLSANTSRGSRIEIKHPEPKRYSLTVIGIDLTDNKIYTDDETGDEYNAPVELCAKLNTLTLPLTITCMVRGRTIDTIETPYKNESDTDSTDEQ